MSSSMQWLTLGYHSEAWQHIESGLCVITAVEVANDNDGIDRGPEYHISVSRRVERCSSADALWVRSEFGMLDAEEDNHVPNGKVRNFLKPVADKFIGMECACKDEEPVIREDKGDYIWRGITK